MLVATTAQVHDIIVWRGMRFNPAHLGYAEAEGTHDQYVSALAEVREMRQRIKAIRLGLEAAPVVAWVEPRSERG